MRKILLAILIIFTTISIQAQIVKIDTVKNQTIILKTKGTSTKYQQYLYSIGIKVFSYEQFPKLLNQVNSTKYKEIPLNGFIFKFNDNQISYRLSGSFYNKNISFNNECIDCEIAKGKLRDYSIKLGFEKNLSYSIIQPYFGFDIGFRNNEFKGSSQNAGNIVAFSTPYNVTSEKNGGIFAPVLGLKFNLINHYLTIGAESSMDFMFNYERQTKTYQDAARTNTLVKSKKTEFLLRPANLFVQFNFGAAD